jgi:hypothetical protein
MGSTFRWLPSIWTIEPGRINGHMVKSVKPITPYACNVLQAWKKEGASKSEYVFPSPVLPNRPIWTVQNRLENDIETSGRASVSDLQPASRLLHSSQ